jgi:hypothetical protein
MDVQAPNQAGTDSERTPIEIARDLVASNPGLTVKDLVDVGRQQGLSLEKREMNSALYKLIGLRSVEAITSSEGSAPKWFPVLIDRDSTEPTPAKPMQVPDARYLVGKPISESRVAAFQRFLLKGGEFVSVGIMKESSNDPYVSIDVLDERIVIAINSAHPICESLAHTEESWNLLVATAIVDAVTQTRINRSSKISPKGPDLISVRDAVLREFALIEEPPIIQREVPGGTGL